MNLPKLIEEARAAKTLSAEHKKAIEETVSQVDSGQLRVAEPQGDHWVTHAWIKQAILLYFRIREMSVMECDPFTWVDKIPLKTWRLDQGVRSVPPATVRYGAHISPRVILMPSFVNIGAYVDEGTMVDTWATVGSCAQIGKNVHLSGGVGIGGVLEPAQAAPVIVEDDCFLGSRAIVVEGVHLKRGVVLGAGVVLTASTPIIDTQTGVSSKGVVAENSVVIPGTRVKKFLAGEFNIPCALVIGKRSASTDLKTSLNQALRDFEVSV